MSNVDLLINDIDYDSLFSGFDTISNTTTSPTTENDADSRISDTPPMINGLNPNFDIWPWNIDSPLSDDPNGESFGLDALINDQNPLMLSDGVTDSENSTINDFLAALQSSDKTDFKTLQKTPSLSPSSIQNPYPSPPPSSSYVTSPTSTSVQRPILLPKPIITSSTNQNNYLQQQITNCVKLQSYAGAASTGPKCVKIEPVINTTPPQPPPANITIITTSKPITVAKVPMIKMPLTTTTTATAATPITIVKTEADSVTPTNIKRITTVYPNNMDNQSITPGTLLKTLDGNNSMISPPAKRRRSESSTNHQQLPIQSPEITTLTLDQLKVQYGNVSEEALKKHLRMIKNRESASLSRKRRKQLMENLEVKVKELTDENERLKNENTKLQTRIYTLEMENELIKTYKPGNPVTSPTARKSLMLMGIVLLVVFNIFTLKSLVPDSNNPSGSIALYNGHSNFDNERTIVRGRTILNARQNSIHDPFVAGSENDDSSGGVGNNNNNSFITTYPYLQCVAYINKTHSQRINRELHSWVQDHYRKNEPIDNHKSITIPDRNSITIPSNSDSEPVTNPNEQQQHVPRKLALLNRRLSKTQSNTKGQLQTYKGYDSYYEDFIHAIDRRNDTLYFVSFKRDHLILPATVTNQTQRPKMSLILPASITHLNKSIHVPANHVPMIQIDCEVEDTKLVFVKRGHIPSFYRHDLFRYYSSVPQTTV